MKYIKPVRISERDLSVRAGQYDGFCTTCREWTDGGVEPDAIGYICPSCGMNTVYGAEELVMIGLVHILGSRGDEQEGTGRWRRSGL